MNSLKINQKIFDPNSVRADFPALQQQVNGHNLVYLDNSGTTQKPQSVIDAIINFYRDSNANVHRGVHTLSERASHSYEKTRLKVKNFINAKSQNEIVFTKGTTESINLVAHSYGLIEFNPGDEIILSVMEHHSNIVPWQLLTQQKQLKIHYIDVDENGELNLQHYQSLLNNKTKLVAVTHVSNVLGTINPIKEIIAAAHHCGAKVLIDGAQAIAHLTIDVQELDCDFYVFSGHKMYGPTGVGVLYGKSQLLEKMSPYQCGGGMITQVSLLNSEYKAAPEKFEAGTPNIEGVIALGTAIDYLQTKDLKQIAFHELDLLNYATNQLNNISGLGIIGTAKNKSAVISFVLNDAHPHDVATILDQYGVAVRAGHHCAMPLTERFAISATVRASFAMYNTKNEVDKFLQGLEQVMRIFH